MYSLLSLLEFKKRLMAIADPNHCSISFKTLIIFWINPNLNRSLRLNPINHMSLLAAAKTPLTPLTLTLLAVSVPF